MLAMLGPFFFEINKTDYQELSETLTFQYAEHKRALSYTHTEATGEFTNSFDLAGTLILKDVYSLEKFKALGKLKLPTPLVFETGFFYWVTIREITIKSSRFTQSGAPLKREFTIKLERKFFDAGILSTVLNFI